MKRLEELNITAISLGKEKNDTVKTVQYDVNESIFKLNKSYLFKSEAELLKDSLIQAGINLKDDNTTASVTLKTKLKEYIRILTEYINTYKENSDIIQKMISYTIARYVKSKKDNGLTVTKMIKFLDEYKRVKDNVEDTTNLNLKSFNDMQKELLTNLVKYYS